MTGKPPESCMEMEAAHAVPAAWRGTLHMVPPASKALTNQSPPTPVAAENETAGIPLYSMRAPRPAAGIVVTCTADDTVVVAPGARRYLSVLPSENKTAR